MTALLRQDHAVAIRRFTGPALSPASPDPSAPFITQVADLEAALGRMAAELSAVKAGATGREAAAREEGRRAARTDDEARVQAIATAATRAEAALQSGLTHLERLAGALAELGLEKLFGEDMARRDMVEATIRAAMARLRAGAAVRVLVSRCDFSPSAADALADAVAPLPVAVDDRFGAGEVRLELELGALDLSLDAQWERLRDALRRLPEGDAR